MSQSPIRAGAALLAIVAAVASAVPAQDDPSRGGRGRTGDGRGLATFGDRGLTTFSDRGLTSFSDIPLAPMGGLEADGWSARTAGRRSGERPPRPRRTRRLFDQFPPAPSAEGRTASVASIRGVVLGTPAAPRVQFVLPPVSLPPIVLDHRPALEQMRDTLAKAAVAARARGDVGLARSLAPAPRD